MTLSTGAIREFREIYTKQFSEHLLDSEAEHKALEMLKLFKKIYSSTPQKDREYGDSKGKNN